MVQLGGIFMAGEVEIAQAMARLEATSSTLTGQVTKLTEAVERNNEKLERLAVLESSHATTISAVDRAFDAIKAAKSASEKVEADLSVKIDRIASEADAKYQHYDKYLWLAVGFITCVSVVWSVLGYRMLDGLDDASQKISRFELHVAQDKVMSTDDVRGVVNGR